MYYKPVKQFDDTNASFFDMFLSQSHFFVVVETDLFSVRLNCYEEERELE